MADPATDTIAAIATAPGRGGVGIVRISGKGVAAAMIMAASRGNVQALTLVSNMAEQMSRAGGPLARLAAVVRPLINGERDPDVLCKGMNSQTEKLVMDILADIRKAELN